MKPQKYDTSLDYKGRVCLPQIAAEKFAGQAEVSVVVRENRCLAIYPRQSSIGMFEGTVVPLKRCLRKQKYAIVRLTIPQELRELHDIVSFHFGRTITLVCKRGFVEIQPRPAQS